jgi:nitronate monooxygenase
MRYLRQFPVRIVIVTNIAFLRDLGIEHPIIQAPMSGGPTTPVLVATVSNAGGMGSLGAAYLTPDQIASDIRQIRTLTDKPFNVNLFAGEYARESHIAAQPMLKLLAEIHEELALPPPTLPTWPPNPFEEQLEVVLATRPAVFSFTFGIPDTDAMARLKARGIATIGTATTAEEGRQLEERGANAIAAQGAEAGGHRGTFAGPFEAAMVPTLELVRALHGKVSIPVIASGGLMDGSDMAESLASGAIAAQLGTAFLACPEAGTSRSYKEAIGAAKIDRTVITRVFSGRPARALTNTFIEQLAGKEEIILPYPLQNILTRPMRNAAAKRGMPGFLSLFAGQGVTRARIMPAAELFDRLLAELNQATVTGN